MVGIFEEELIDWKEGFVSVMFIKGFLGMRFGGERFILYLLLVMVVMR